MKILNLIWKLSLPFLFFAAAYSLFNWQAKAIDPQFFRPFPTSALKVMEGDSMDWKEPSYSDEHWGERIPYAPAIYWWRTKVQLDTFYQTRDALGLNIRSFLGSYEVYWDGHLIGKNGVWGASKAEEVPGGIDKLFMLPPMMTQAGEHLIAVRVSQHYAENYRTYPFIKLGSYNIQSQTLLVFAVFMHILVGCFLIIAVYYFLLYFKSFRELAFLIFALLNLLLFSWMVFEYLKFYYAYPYPFHFPRIKIISWLVFFLTIGITTFFAVRYKVPRKGWIIYIQIFIQLVMINLESDFDKRTLFEVNFSLGISMLILLWAIWKKQKYALESLLSIMPILATPFFFYPLFYDQTLFVAYSFFMLTNLYILSKSIGDLRKELEAAHQRAYLLKIELLKKNIQPHFLMNTLTSLISWVEESPKVAIEFIEALAVEFRVLNSIADKKQISMKEELDLCRSHLKVMQFRNEINYQLRTEGVDEKELIPPALFLNLIENGLTHNLIQGKEALFYLKFSVEKGNRKYEFFAPGKPLLKEKKVTPGTGWKYIKARLEENYGDKWEMESKAVEDGWQTILKF